MPTLQMFVLKSDFSLHFELYSLFLLDFLEFLCYDFVCLDLDMYLLIKTFHYIMEITYRTGHRM